MSSRQPPKASDLIAHTLGAAWLAVKSGEEEVVAHHAG